MLDKTLVFNFPFTPIIFFTIPGTQANLFMPLFAYKPASWEGFGAML